LKTAQAFFIFFFFEIVGLKSSSMHENHLILYPP
jgi:hypothetical protein